MVNLNSISLSPRRVVLLGGSGFIGFHLLRGLSAVGMDVLCLGSSDLDLSKASAIEELKRLLYSTDSVIFLSAITPDKGRDADVFLKNLMMTKHLCQALKAKPVNHLVYFSSDAVYGQRQSFISENSPLAPQDLYGAMHLSREIMLSELREIPTMILRVTMVYGPGDTHSSYGPNRFFKTAKQSGVINLYGGGEEMRDHIHVDDVAKITKLCINMKTQGILNLATGKSNSFKNVARIVANQFSNTIEIIENPRIISITHRHYDVTNLIKTFPLQSFIDIEDGAHCYQSNQAEI
jgi:nucleoside-diphosphate-sugar epimerase